MVHTGTGAEGTAEDSLPPKSIIIDGARHARLKRFCKRKSLKIGAFVEKLIDRGLDEAEKA